MLDHMLKSLSVLVILFFISGCGERSAKCIEKLDGKYIYLTNIGFFNNSSLSFRYKHDERSIPGKLLDFLEFNGKDLLNDYVFDGSIGITDKSVRVMLTYERSDKTPIRQSTYTTTEQEGPGLVGLLLGDKKTRDVTVQHTTVIYSEEFHMNGEYEFTNGLTSR